MYIKDITPTNQSIIDEFETQQYNYFDKYYKLHTRFIQPLNIKIDIPLFESEIKQYHKDLEPGTLIGCIFLVMEYR